MACPGGEREICQKKKKKRNQSAWSHVEPVSAIDRGKLVIALELVSGQR